MTEIQKSADPQDPPFPNAVSHGPIAAGELAEESVISTPPVTAQPDAPPTAVQLALHVGWTMAVLYGAIQAPPAGDLTQLPGVHGLQPDQRRVLELKRLGHLLEQLAVRPGIQGSGLPTAVPASDADETALRGTLPALNLTILQALAVCPPEVELAYELGRSLRDTVNPPPEREAPHAPALARQLGRGRIAKLQEWLATLSLQFPQHAAAIVAASLGRWSEFAAVTLGRPNTMLKGQAVHAPATMCNYLLPQGDHWLRLLIGTDSTVGLRRSTAILRRLRRRYLLMLIFVAAVLGAVIYLIVTFTSGAVTVLTLIAAIGGSLGITARGIASMIASVMTKDVTRPIFGLAGEAEEDAMVWAITTMPALPFNRRGYQRLHRAGIAKPSSLSQV